MRNWGCRLCVASLLAAIWAVNIEAADVKRLDGVHRIVKEAEITQPAVLGRRDDQCGASMKLCPSSLNGGCCPENYDCATDSCYATTNGPSTCGGRTSWYQCDAVYGGGCCPEGYMCETADGCIPPTGSPYTYDCPKSQYLCPSSLSYGCCPNGMGCAVNQCYSTEPVTVTSTMVITTTEDGARTTYRTTAVTVETPTRPTGVLTVDAGDDGNQYVMKIFPSAVSKVSPTATSSDDGGGGGGGLSTGALAGIIGGSIAFLIIVLVTAFIVIRHLNKVVAAVSTSKVSENSRNTKSTRPPVKEFKSADSQVDEWSANPLIAPPRPANPGPDSGTNSPFGMASGDRSSNDPTPGADGYQAVSGSAGTSRHTSFDAMGNREDYFNNLAAAGPQHRYSQVSRLTGSTRNRSSGDSHGTYQHVRHWSNASEGSDGTPGVMPTPTAELEATPWVPELPSSPSSVAFPTDERRRSSSSGVGVTTRPPVAHQRLGSGGRVRSDSLGQSNLSIVNEEIHGFYGPSSHLVGQTDTHRPGTRESGNRQRERPSEPEQ